MTKDRERAESGDQYQLHTLHLLLLEGFLEHLPKLGGVGGVQAIPFMQVGTIELVTTRLVTGTKK